MFYTTQGIWRYRYQGWIFITCRNIFSVMPSLPAYERVHLMFDFDQWMSNNLTNLTYSASKVDPIETDTVTCQRSLFTLTKWARLRPVNSNYVTQWIYLNVIIYGSNSVFNNSHTIEGTMFVWSSRKCIVKMLNC